MNIAVTVVSMQRVQAPPAWPINFTTSYLVTPYTPTARLVRGTRI
jgi:hypothetical protein